MRVDFRANSNAMTVWPKRGHRRIQLRDGVTVCTVPKNESVIVMGSADRGKLITDTDPTTHTSVELSFDEVRSIVESMRAKGVDI